MDVNVFDTEHYAVAANNNNHSHIMNSSSMSGVENVSSGSSKSVREKKYRRTRRVVKHANPLFERWLLQWQQEAEKRGSNMKYNFQRARKSLSLFPVPLYTGQDCKLLANFGNKICQMLDRRLAQHEGEFGATDWSQIHKIKETPRKRKKKTSAMTSVAISTTAIPDPTTNTSSARSRKPLTPLSMGKQSGSGETLRKGKSQTKRQYIPSLRSGAYALLMALHQATLLPHYQGFLKKDELVAAAQPLCDASLSRPEKVGCYYTAWSSMTTLIKKGLVSCQSHPPRFSITAEGKAVALKLESVEWSPDAVECTEVPAATLIPSGSSKKQLTRSSIHTHTVSSSDDDDDDDGGGGGDDDNDGGSGVKEVSCSPPCTPLSLTTAPQLGCTVIEKEKEEDEKEEWDKGGGRADTLQSPAHNWNYQVSCHCPPPQSPTSPSGGLRFSYMTALELETPLKDHARVTVEEDGFLGFLIKCGASALQGSGLHYRLDSTRIASRGFVYAYLSNECAPDQCTGLDKTAAKATPLQAPITAPKQCIINPRKNSPAHPPSEATIILSHKKKSAQPQVGLTTERLTTVPLVGAPTAIATPASSYVPFTLLPGSYEIILCVDIAETSGRAAGIQTSNKDVILSELRRNNVKYDVRKLHVGDYLWVCRETHPDPAVSLGPSPKVRELVLPVVVERKRMDDLACSIKDGRFREQKFRLKQCGLSRPVYLVEEHHGSVDPGISLPEMTCLQAIVNTQVINGFIVKVVKGQRESAAYLTIMTRYLQSKYQNSTVKSAQLQSLKESRTLPPLETEISLPLFSEFNAASMKNQQLTVQEMFAKHLLQLHGVSADKARAVVDMYGTPCLLMNAYKDVADTSKAKELLADLKWGRAGRSLGPVLSANIASLYTTPVLQ